MNKKKILVIDDDEMNLQIAKMILERKLPCEVFCASSGLDGIDILLAERVDLVLLDIMMPDFDGIETLQEIRANEKISGVPVIMLTASGDIENIQKVGFLGVKDYIKKPFLPADLIKRVEVKLAEIHSEEILLLGDNEKILQEMRQIIEENFSHEVSIATSPATAEKILRDQKINLIIAYADMKFVDGLKFLSLVAADENFGAIPFALTTAEKLLELLNKMNPQQTEEPPPKIDQSSAALVANSDKKKLAGVVTTLIGYELDVHI